MFGGLVQIDVVDYVEVFWHPRRLGERSLFPVYEGREIVCQLICVCPHPGPPHTLHFLALGPRVGLGHRCNPVVCECVGVLAQEALLAMAVRDYGKTQWLKYCNPSPM